MYSDTTSLARARRPGRGWRGYFAFLKRSRLPAQPTGFSGPALREVLQLYLLDLAFMVILLTLAIAAMAQGTAIPQNSVGQMAFGAGLVAVIVIAAPIVEEVLFRSWLSGRPGHLFLIPVLIAGAVLGPAFVGFAAYQILAAQGGGSLPGPVAVAVVAAFLAAIAAAGAWRWRGRPPMGWFARIFPLAFWLSTVIFAFVHVFNFPDAGMLTVLPFVLPQFVAGSIFGYARVAHGLWASILLHMLHNATFVAIVLIGLQVGSTA